MASPRSLAMLVGIPAVYGFAPLLGGNDGFSVGAQSAGSAFFPNLQAPPYDTWPADLCSQLPNIKVLTGNVWCGSRKTEDACQVGDVLRLGAGGNVMTVGGLARAYDVCAWDRDTGKCRLAPASFYCNVNCPGVTPAPARSPSSANVDRRNVCSKKALESKSQFGVNDQGEFTAVYRVAETCRVVLSRNAGRRLQEEEAPKVETRRKLALGTCPANAVTHTMKNGGICCDTSGPNVELAAPFQPDLTNPALENVREGCTYNSDTDECKCEVVTEPTGSDVDTCPTIGPSYWVGF